MKRVGAGVSPGGGSAAAPSFAEDRVPSEPLLAR